MIRPQKEHEEFYRLFSMKERQEQKELLQIMEDIAQHSKRDNTQIQTYIDWFMKRFQMTGEINEPLTEEEQISYRALIAFAVLKDGHQKLIVNGLKG